METKEQRIKEILTAYICHDLKSTDPDHVRNVLLSVCGCNKKELKELGFEWLFGKEK